VLEPPRGEDARVPPAAPPAETREDPPAPPRPAIATTIRGRVVDAATDEPIDAFEILCAPAGAERHLVDTLLGMESSTASASVSFAGSRGRFEIRVLDGETRSVCAFARGYERCDPTTATPGADLALRLNRAGIVRGRVVDPATGNPVEGALVGWIDHQGKPRTGPRERFTRTDALGRFELASVPFSARTVLAGREDLGEGMSERLELTPEHSEREVVIGLRRSGG